MTKFGFQTLLGMLILLPTMFAYAADREPSASGGLKIKTPGYQEIAPPPKPTPRYEPLSASQELDVTNVEYGIFQTRAAQGDQGGDRLEFEWGGLQPITETTYVPARVGVKFGLRYNLKGPGSKQPVRVKLLYLTPGLVDPVSGKHQDKIEIVQEISPRARFNVIALQFADEFEIVPGSWHLHVYHEDRRLLEKTFIVVK